MTAEPEPVDVEDDMRRKGRRQRDVLREEGNPSKFPVTAEPHGPLANWFNRG